MRAEVPQHVDVGLHQPEVDPHRVDVLDVAELAAQHQLADLEHRRRVAVGVVAHQHQAPLVGRGHELLALGQRGRQRLLDQHVLARFERSQHDLGVGGGRRGHGHGHDLGIVEHPAEIVGDLDATGVAQGPPGAFLVEIAYPAKVPVGTGQEVPDQVGAPVPGADHGDAHGAHRVFLSHAIESRKLAPTGRVTLGTSATRLTP